ncbi:hypothetical protein SEVIR_3G129633v4 [Setaria viridis]|uniref:Uncharacterized protein n=1 Tax=Setaria viridis TaxID=4556 RepID=A0A4U6VED0_SETVI|nr:hypothetical protein SEVIR_3G129633v2 [Setaria viridis]
MLQARGRGAKDILSLGTRNSPTLTGHSGRCSWRKLGLDAIVSWRLHRPSCASGKTICVHGVPWELGHGHVPRPQEATLAARRADDVEELAEVSAAGAGGHHGERGVDGQRREDEVSGTARAISRGLGAMGL